LRGGRVIAVIDGVKGCAHDNSGKYGNNQVFQGLSSVWLRNGAVAGCSLTTLESEVSMTYSMAEATTVGSIYLY